MDNEQKAVHLMNAIIYRTLQEDRKPSKSEQMVYDVCQNYLQLLECTKNERP